MCNGIELIFRIIYISHTERIFMIEPSPIFFPNPKTAPDFSGGKAHDAFFIPESRSISRVLKVFCLHYTDRVFRILPMSVSFFRTVGFYPKIQSVFWAVPDSLRIAIVFVASNGIEVFEGKVAFRCRQRWFVGNSKKV